MTEDQELALREELEAGVLPDRELAIREELDSLSNDAPAPVQEAPEENFMDRQSQNVKERQDFLQEGISSYVKNPNFINARMLLMDAAGSTVGAAFDTIGNAIVTGVTKVAEQAPDQLGEAVSEGYKTFINAIPPEVRTLMKSTAKDAFEIYDTLEEKYPMITRQLGNTANVLLAATPTPKANPAAKPSRDFVAKFGDDLVRKGRLQKAKNSRNSILDMTREVPKVEDDIVKNIERTREQSFSAARGRKEIATDFEKAVARDVSRVPGIDTNRSFLHNSNKIVDERTRLAKDFSAKLEALPKPTKSLNKETIAKIDANVNKLLKKEKFLTQQKEAVKITVEKAKEIIANSDNSAGAIWGSRIELDDWIREANKGYPEGRGAFAKVNEEIRRTINSVVSEEAAKGGINAPRFFSKYSNLKVAAKPIALKADKEGANVVYRTLAKLKDITGARNETLALIATGLGTTALAASQTFAAPVGVALTTGIALRGIYKALKSPGAKNTVGLLIKATDDGIKAATNPTMIRQLRADRALLVELSERLEKESGE